MQGSLQNQALFNRALLLVITACIVRRIISCRFGRRRILHGACTVAIQLFPVLHSSAADRAQRAHPRDSTFVVHMELDLEACFATSTNQVPVSTLRKQSTGLRKRALFVTVVDCGEGNVWARDKLIGLLPLQSPLIRSFDGDLQASTAQELEMTTGVELKCLVLQQMMEVFLSMGRSMLTSVIWVAAGLRER